MVIWCSRKVLKFSLILSLSIWDFFWYFFLLSFNQRQSLMEWVKASDADEGWEIKLLS